jgi:hypothetical protein
VRKQQHHRENNELVELSVLRYDPRELMSGSIRGFTLWGRGE